MTIAVIDTNLLLSALINPAGLPQRVLLAWADQRRFILATCAFQLAELRTVMRRKQPYWICDSGARCVAHPAWLN